MIKKMIVVVADDHPLVQEGLQRLLSQAGFMVVAAKDGEEAIEKAEKFQPDLVLWDLLMPEGGLASLRKIKERFPHLKILVLTALDTPGLGGEVLRAGAQGLVAKTADPQEIVDAVRAVLRGETVLPKETNVTARDRQILSLLAQGLRIVEIAEKLKISPKTVESHLEHLKEKLCCRSVPELRALALRWQSPTNSPSPKRD